MSKPEAHALLDAAKAGVPVPEYKIRLALQATGDLDSYRPEFGKTGEIVLVRDPA